MSSKSIREITYLALGDSYTIGESVAEAERFPVQLSQALKENNIPVKETKIIATTGWTTADLKNGILNASIGNKTFDLVSLLIGVNNYYQGKSLEEYKKEFKDLLLQSISFAGGNKDHVFVVSIPDYGYTPFGQSDQATISHGIDSFNAANKAIAGSLGITYFNITPLSRNGLSDPSFVAADGLHPSGKQYKLWVDLMKEEVMKVFL